MSRDDVINTSDADHMILVYHLQPHDKPFKFREKFRNFDQKYHFENLKRSKFSNILDKN